MIRVVLDTSVVVSATISPGSAADFLIAAVEDGRLDLVYSPTLLAEIECVLARPKFKRYVSADEVRRYIQALVRMGRAAADPAIGSRSTRDRKDDYLVALATTTDAILVSGDRDLLEAEGIEPLVLAPRAMLELLERDQSR